MRCLEPVEFEFKAENSSLSVSNYSQSVDEYINRSPVLSFLQALMTECFRIVLPSALLFIAVFWFFERWQ